MNIAKNLTPQTSQLEEIENLSSGSLKNFKSPSSSFLKRFFKESEKSYKILHNSFLGLKKDFKMFREIRRQENSFMLTLMADGGKKRERVPHKSSLS